MQDLEAPNGRARTLPARAALVLLALALLALGCKTTRLTPPPQEAPAAGPYLVGEGDVLAIRVWKNQELSVEVPVRPDGMISVPLLNDVKAAGSTTDQLKAEITGKLSEFISAPDVTVVVLQANSKRAFVLGEVQRPGPVQLSSQLFVLDVLSAAGGFTPFADENDIRIIRRGADGQELEFRFDYDAYVAGRAPGTNIALQPGDTIIVPQ
jgi:polysaccharide export outer membrane protein